MDRRSFTASFAVAAGAAASPALGATRRPQGRTILYSACADRLIQYDLDVATGALIRRGTVTLPSVIQYAWPHPTGRYLYVSSSDQPGGSRTVQGDKHRLVAYRIGPSGALTPHGAPAVLAQRPIHNSLDHTGRFALSAYNTIADASVHRINSDGTLGAMIDQGGKLDAGIFPHQVRATPGNRSVVLVTRGNGQTGSPNEDPGALKLFRFAPDGRLSPLQTVQVGGKGGLGYGPRHCDFHPAKPWVYVAIERQNQIMMHRMNADGSFVAEPDFIKPTTSEPARAGAQVAGAIHVHPKGHVVYVSNRASGTVDFNGQKVARGGDNSIAVFAIDPRTGEPRQIQTADTRGYHARTFTIDPSGTLLIAATMVEMLERDGDTVKRVPAGLTVFRIEPDGRLTFVRKHEVALGKDEQQVWVHAMNLPA